MKTQSYVRFFKQKQEKVWKLLIVLYKHKKINTLIKNHCNGSVMSGAGHSLALHHGSRRITCLLATQNNNFQTIMLIDEI